MIETLSLAEWIAFDRAHPAPTFFARPAWSLALADCNERMQIAPLRIHANGSTTIVPLLRMHGGPLRWREYSGFPLGGYTCFFNEDGTLASAAQCDEAVAELAQHCDIASIVPWPLAPGPAAAGKEHETGVVDLSEGIDAALSRVEGIFRRMAGQAQRRGVTCGPSRDPQAVDVYYQMLEASAKRWGLDQPPIPKRLIASLKGHGGDDVEIWFAREGERAIAGGVVFYGSQEFFFWSAAMLAEFGRLRPSNALNYALMQGAADRGMLWYNLGSSEGLPGVARFKHEMGARSVPYRDVAIARTRFKVYSNVRRALRARASV